MGAHPDDTWCQKIDGDNSPKYVNWLKDEPFLPAVVPHARIMRYGYNSRWFGDNAIKTKMSDISQTFLFELKHYRKASPRLRNARMPYYAMLSTLLRCEISRRTQAGRLFLSDTVLGASLF